MTKFNFKLLSFCFLFLFCLGQVHADQSMKGFLNARGFFQSESNHPYFQFHFVNHKKRMAVQIVDEVFQDRSSGWGVGSEMYNYYPPRMGNPVYYDVLISRPSEAQIFKVRNRYPGLGWFEVVNPDQVAKNTFDSFLYRRGLRDTTPYGEIVDYMGMLELNRDIAKNKLVRESLEQQIQISRVAKLYPAAKFLEDLDTYSHIFPHMNRHASASGAEFLGSLTRHTIYAKPDKIKSGFLRAAYQFMIDSRVWEHDIYASGTHSKGSIVKDALKILRGRR
ncbi:MAG: hypothetical protein J0L93_02660 [Deltaproteobacteria bacterium]|nr:hypothetical protein [Deltaproteobacteria bacterium]